MYEICLLLASFTVAVVEKSVSSKSNDKNPSDDRANNAGSDSNFDLSCPNSLLDDTKPPFTNCGDNTNHRIVLLQTRRPHVQAAIAYFTNQIYSCSTRVWRRVPFSDTPCRLQRRGRTKSLWFRNDLECTASYWRARACNRSAVWTSEVP
jgi:hypothetical protein